MSFGNIDSDFDRYRKNRIRHQHKVAMDGSGGNNYENSALRELEQVEARELQDQQLTREVHDFFADATRQAATIVERMAHDAEAEADVKVEQEMESFLIDAFARMNTLVMHMLHQKKGGGETKLEPRVANLVGKMLDEFRFEGTADLLDKHIGMDPFDIDLDEVRREFLESVGEQSEMDTDGPVAPIEEHLVANVEAATDGDDAANRRDDDDMPAIEVVEDVEDDRRPRAQTAPAQPAAAPARVPRPSTPGALAERLGATAAAAEPAANGAEGGNAAGGESRAELERFKEALKSLVRQGTMTREEARAAWATRLRKLGLLRG